jgi:SAM-dependent methyltransferase
MTEQIGTDAWAMNADARLAEIDNDQSYAELQRMVLAGLRRYGKHAGSSVLDVGCGLGVLTNRLYQEGYDVMGVDPSATTSIAAQNFPHLADRLVHQDIDGFAKLINQDVVGGYPDQPDDEPDMLLLQPFEAAVANMTLHAVSDLLAVCRAVRTCLYDHASFVITLPHPAFYLQTKGRLDQPYDYGEPAAYQRTFKIHNGRPHPAPTPYYHRPLSAYFSALIEAGFQFESSEEPTRASPGPPDSLILYLTALPRDGLPEIYQRERQLWGDLERV